jgi:hypothetical protein
VTEHLHDIGAVDALDVGFLASLIFQTSFLAYLADTLVLALVARQAFGLHGAKQIAVGSAGILALYHLLELYHEFPLGLPLMPESSLFIHLWIGRTWRRHNLRLDWSIGNIVLFAAVWTVPLSLGSLLARGYFPFGVSPITNPFLLYMSGTLIRIVCLALPAWCTYHLILQSNRFVEVISHPCRALQAALLRRRRETVTEIGLDTRKPL